MKPFYHVSRKDIGSRVSFKPKVPESSVISKEGNIPRVCVSDDVFFCLRSIGGISPLSVGDILPEFEQGDVYYSPVVYQTVLRVPFLPPKISDFRRNHEHWFLTPVWMNRRGFIDIESLIAGQVKIISHCKTIATTVPRADKQVLINREVLWD